MEKQLKSAARALWPEIEALSGTEYVSALFNVSGFLYSTPFVIAGLAWLITVTDLAIFRTQWPILCLLLALLFLFDQLDFFFFVEITPGIYSDWQSSLSTIIVWSAAFIFGPTSLWLAVLYACIHYSRRWFKYPATDLRWNCARNFNLNMVEILTSLIALRLYVMWASKNAPGNAFPLPGLTLQSILPAFSATFFWWFLPTLLWTILLIYFERQRLISLTSASRKAYLKFWIGALGWPILAGPFAVLAAGLFTQNGLGGYLFLHFQPAIGQLAGAPPKPIGTAQPAALPRTGKAGAFKPCDP